MTFEEKHNKLLEYFDIKNEWGPNLFYSKVVVYSKEVGLFHLFMRLNSQPNLIEDFAKSNEYMLFTHLLYKKIFG